MNRREKSKKGKRPCKIKTILSVLPLFFCLSVGAQELSVKSFDENARDLSARQYSRMDNNDVPCALLKVQLASAGAQFEGTVMGNVDYRTSEYWVYMPKGSKRLTVKLEGYLPLSVEFENYGVRSLESNVTYTLTVSGVMMGGQQLEVRTKTGWIILDSDPQGAAVYVGGEFVGNTPLEDYKQPYGTYEYRLEKPNYHSASGTIELNSSQLEKVIRLSPAFGSITVSSNIGGAMVLLDGRSTDKTAPCTLTEVPSGSHVVSLSKDKYTPRQYDVAVEDGKVAQVAALLDARFASITIQSLIGAEIFIDGSRKGTGTTTLDLMDGFHDAEVRLAHHRVATRQFQVVAGQPQTLTLNPVPIYGSLDVTSTPRKADIIIDGKRYGQTPYTVEQLLEGEHSVTLSLEGNGQVTKHVVIREGITSVVSATFQNGSITTKSSNANEVQSGSNSSKEIVHEYVDLGLPSGTLWAKCNIGAEQPEEYGDYFSWGETNPKPIYNRQKYKFYSEGLYTKYCTDSQYGVVDNLKVLDNCDDAAYINWGSKWRMPTYEEQEELISKCSWTSKRINGNYVFQIEGPNGNFIYLPIAGFINNSGKQEINSLAYYWSSSLYTEDASRKCASAYNLWGRGLYNNYRSDGMPIRPVINEKALKVAEKANDSSNSLSNDFDKLFVREISGTNELISASGNRIFTIKGVSFAMVPIEGGTFMMGGTKEQGDEIESDEQPAHSVTLSNYYMGETEVTQALWQVVMGNNPSELKGDDLPVNRVSWQDCQEFVKKLNLLTGRKFRLPTEAEWEYAARGGNKSKGYKYSGGDNIEDVAWINENSGHKLHPVKSKNANELGIYDMSGNAWECCLDRYNWYEKGAQTNPQGPRIGTDRIIRGGSYDVNAKRCRVSFRSFDTPNGRHLGLRLVLSE